MNLKTKCFILILLFLLVGISSVSASEIDDTNSTLSHEFPSIENDTQSEFNSVNLDAFQEETDTQNFPIESSNSQEILKDENSDVIVVNNWDELQYYCSLKDDDYTLKLKENTSFYPTDPTDSNYQIKVYNKVKIIGSEGSYIGYNSSNAPVIKYAAIMVPDDVKAGISMENVEFKWISVNYGSDGVFLQMGGRRNNVFKNCQFSYITTTKGHSSIIYLKKGSATLDNCSFIKCTTDYGCISVYDPNSVKSTDMIVRNCYFEGNYARTEPGCINNCGKLTVYNTTFVKNRSFWWAGAIHTHNHGNTTIYDSNFTDNVAGWNGGALYTYSYLQIYNTIFVGNNCTTNSGGGAIGACAFQSNPHIFIENCLFEKNANNCWEIDYLSSGTGSGGAIAMMDEGSIIVLNTTFIANSAAHGSAISAHAAGEYGSPTVIIANNTFINHTVTEALSVSVEGSTATLEGNYFYGNYVLFKQLTLKEINAGKDYATLQVDVRLTNPQYYDSDILNRMKYDVYVGGEYVKTVDSNVFTVDFDGFTMGDVYVIPIISNSKSNAVTIASLGSYIYVSKNIGNDSNNGTLRDYPVKTIKRALELLDDDYSIVILDGVYDEENFQINQNLTIIGTADATLTNNTSFTVNANNFTLKNIKVCNLISDTFVKQIKGNLVINNCIFDNNDCSKLIDGDNVNVVKSIFTNNNIVVYNNAFTCIKNSILLNNTKIIDNNLENINLDYNWWGNTQNNISKPTDFNINNWLVLNATSSINVLEYGQSTNVQFNCYLIENNQITKYSDLVKFNLNVSALNGTVNKNLVNYNSNVIYTQAASGVGVLTAEYDNVSFNLYFDFVKFSPNLVIKASDIMYGQSLEVTVLAPSDIADSKGFYTVSVGGKSLTKRTEYDSFTFDGLSAGDYEITLEFTGSEKYAGKTVTSKISVNKYSTTTKITTSAAEVGNDVILSIITSQNTVGTVTLTVNNLTETLTLSNNHVTYTINNIGRGDYYIKAVYNGNERYAVSHDSIFIEVDNQDPNLSVSVANSSYGGASIVEVVLNEDASGLVTASVEGIINSSEVVNGRAKIYIYGVNVGGNHEVSLFYSGDDTYFNKTVTVYMNVSKGNFTFVMNSEDIYIGHDEVITIIVPAKTKGTFTIDGHVLNIPMSGEVTYTLKDLEIGNYTITATFDSDNYNTVSNSTSFNVMEFDTPQWANDGVNTQNTQKSDYTSDCNDDILWTVKINSTVVSNIIIDSEGNVYLATADGIYSYDSEGNLRWIYSTEGIYGSNFTGLTIGRDVIISPKAGDTVYFVNQNGTRYGYSNIYQASSLFAPIIDANANIYTVSEYQYETSSYNLVITPYNLWENGGDPISISLGNFRPSVSPSVNEDIYVVIGENSIMVLDAKNNEPIFIKTGGFKNVRPVIGEGNLIYTILGDSIVVYRIDGSQFAPLRITGGAGDNLLIDDDLGIIYATNGYGNLYSYDVLNGEETLISDLNITSGILIDGNHNLYFASDNVFYSIDSEGKVLWKTDLSSKITGTPIMNKEGIIYVTSDDNKLFALGDVILADPELEVTTSNITQGENATITIKINDGTTGNVSFSLDGVDYSFDVSNGTIICQVPNLKAGTYTIDVTYSGDALFNRTSKRVTFTVKSDVVPLADPDLAVSIPDITQGENAVITIKINNETTGKVSFTLNGVDYSFETGNGTIFKSISNLPVGTYTVNVTYSGDLTFNKTSKVVTFTVKAKPSPLIPDPILKGSDISVLYTSNSYYKVKLTQNNAPLVGKTIAINFNGAKYNMITDKNGIASFKITAKPGKYTIKASYQGKVTQNTVIVKSILKAKNIRAKKSAKSLKIKVTLKKVNNKYLKNKVLTLKFNKKTFKAKTNKKGVVTFKIKRNVYKKLKTSKKYAYQVIYKNDAVRKTIKFKK